MRALTQNHTALLWIMLLTLASTTTTLALACATPFAALVLGGAGRLPAPALLLRQFVRGGALLIGLIALYHALVALGVPRARPVAA